ncbi:hypothetical protein J1G42_18420 [Cellulomonas sp. zg-ZUI222]|uniref:Flp pilus-assembly TadG-like N-terminal domain-containing protein n=1 Tax=Cellulomonas wangleii TaxID=2816956 RepID=A0ABX8DA95_9CELL|nr:MULTISPECIES: hypothetical protein [Cellulomonas]MBO0900372.1 hypothetical protein [Cellulomonas sp. zg-ZUI22]MBO0922798.1 hypothetical protein [Cellulomonas wangleii]MBO0926337.1 hypothetical protein [Cellulomonas wangleii]QVI63978.1 hypothetical protein KG103_09290 [Cellulomonas wangleii]
MTLSRVLRVPVDERERGAAMVVVLGMTFLLSALVVAGITTSVGAARQSQRDEGWNAALAAAYAGVEEYESRLANDLGYFAYGNPAAPFTVQTGSSSRVSLPGGASANPAFGIGTSGTWATVPGSDGQAAFRYEVDNSQFYIDGTLRIRSTGRAGGDTRSIVADIKQKGFIDFLYFTDFEVMDPQALSPGSAVNCAIRYPSPRPGCTTINFGGADEINGPLHTNDAITTNGAAKFNGKVTTAYKAASGPNYVKSGSSPTFLLPGDPQNIGSIGMPPTNAQLMKEVRHDLPLEVPNPGCLYTGPTSITFHSDGTMTVISPWTKETQVNATASHGTHPVKCGVPGDTGLAKRASGKYVGQRIPVPSNLVVYVQTVPNASGNVNRTDSSPSSKRPPFPGTGSTNDCVTNGNSIGYPRSSEKVPFTAAYGCRSGDVFISGRLSGNATVAAENYIYVTDDIVYDDPAEDMLGLIGNNAVWVWNPVNSSNQPLNAKNRRIDAAILSVAHTFMVQNYDKGSSNRGTLTVNGAIAQKFRGPVGTGTGASMSTGYGKDYNYDERFRYTAPPKFLSPVTTTYGVNVWVEVEPAFDADGSAS